MGKKSRLKNIRKLASHDDRSSQPRASAGGGKFPQKTVILILIFSALMLGIILRVQNLANVRERSPDENVYAYQAKIIAQHGVEGTKLLAREYNLNKELWLYPPPTRVGYLWLLATAMKTANTTDVKTGAYVSCFFSIATLLLIIALGLKFFNRWIALYALLFMSVSPMALAVARRSWQEAIIGFMGLLLVYISCEITRDPRRIFWYILFVIAGSYCVLIKLTGAVIYALCMAWLLWVLFVKEKSPSKGTLLVGLGSLGAVISIALLVHAIGGAPVLKQTLMHFQEGIQTNAYPRDYASGPWYHFFELLWILSPLSTILCFVGGIGAFFPGDTGRKTAASPADKSRGSMLGIIFFTAALMSLLFLAKEHSLNLRYVGALYAPFYLISGLGFWYIVMFAGKILKKFSFSIVIAGIIAAVIAAAASDYRNFKRIIVKPGIKDLSIRLVREAAR